MHVESVTWISERKDVLYTLFYLSALISYLKYITGGEKFKHLAYTFVLFLCSLLSKGQAVTLPAVLLLIDFFMKRSSKVVAEKVPFFVLSVVFSLIAIKAQQPAITQDFYGKFDGVFGGMYALLVYLFKSVVPLNLCGLYPYPFGDAKTVPVYVYFSPVVLGGLIFLGYRFLRTMPQICFGASLFVITISPVLKFIPVGDAIVAERYTYIPYIGLFIMMGVGYQHILQTKERRKFRVVANAVLGIFVLTLSVMTWNRAKVWKDSKIFLSDIVDKYSDYWRGYQCLGQD